MNLMETWRNDSKVNNVRRLTVVLFIIYVFALCWILLFKLGVRFSYMGNRSVNLIPFREFFLNSKIDVGEIILNVLILCRLVYMQECYLKNGILEKNFPSFFLISLMVEGLQFILAVGAFDITDVITNTLGGIIGLMIFKAIEKAFNNTVKAQKFINIIAGTGTVVMILLLLLLKMNMLPVRYQ